MICRQCLLQTVISYKFYAFRCGQVATEAGNEMHHIANSLPSISSNDAMLKETETSVNLDADRSNDIMLRWLESQTRKGRTHDLNNCEPSPRIPGVEGKTSQTADRSAEKAFSSPNQENSQTTPNKQLHNGGKTFTLHLVKGLYSSLFRGFGVDLGGALGY